MLRDKNLIPLSRQHQHVLALCVRIDRASPIRDSDLAAWQAETAQLFQMEVGIHFAAEEQVVFPAARRFEEMIPLVDDLIDDHAALRAGFAQAEAGKMNGTGLSGFAQRMSAHIRKEERQLFERMQKLMTQEELSRLGKNLEAALADAAQACALPTGVTRLRSATESGAKDLKS